VAVQTWSVAELCEAVGETLAARFDGQVWVRGEIHGYRVGPGGHVWFDLVEPGTGADRRVSRLPVVLFAGTRRGLEAFLRRTTGLELADGVEVRVRGPIDFYGPQARVQLQMQGIDPRHTLGQLAADRERVMRLLAEEGLLGRNAALAWPPVPLRIGLITSDDSAAANDFLEELRASGFGFRVTVSDVRVQGAAAGDMIALALSRLADEALDVVALVRGGGSRIDLACFDSEPVARAIATHPVPVLTGIGHEIDRAVADDVAHAAYKTPTACARAIVDAVTSFDTALATTWRAVLVRAQAGLAEADRQVEERAQRAARGTTASLAGERERLDDRARRLRQAAAVVVDRAAERQVHRSGALATIGRLQLRGAETALDRCRSRLPGLARRPLERAGRELDGLAAVVDAVHPDRVLARGYSITTGPDGRVVRRASSVTPGDRLLTRLSAGLVTSTVTDATEPQEEM
jgi:exodeoxyribonuclease VII large subunit